MGMHCTLLDSNELADNDLAGFVSVAQLGLEDQPLPGSAAVAPK